MTTCFLMIPPNGFVSAMSCRDIGGNGPPPRDTNQTPSHERVQSVRRRLFGDVDHQQTRLDLEHQLTRCEELDRNKYNFDFITQQPISSSDSRYEWSHISAQDSTNASIDTNDTTFDSKLPQEFSTKLCKASDQSSTQSQSATTSTTTSTTSSTPPPLQSLQPLSTCGPTLASDPTSGALSPDSQPQASSSSEALTAKVGHKSPTVVHSKQTKITGILHSFMPIIAILFAIYLSIPAIYHCLHIDCTFIASTTGSAIS
jgi:hypothetical protein